MIRPCNDDDIQDIYEIINDAAKAYRGVIPDDQWYDPYMSKVYLHGNQMHLEIDIQ